MRKPTQDGGGNCYIVPKGDRVTVVFAVDFADETDKAVTRIFLQEFVEAQRSVNNCPPANFSRGAEPPMEVRDELRSKSPGLGIDAIEDLASLFATSHVIWSSDSNPSFHSSL